jgi:hypothetical protein
MSAPKEMAPLVLDSRPDGEQAAHDHSPFLDTAWARQRGRLSFARSFVASSFNTLSTLKHKTTRVYQPLFWKEIWKHAREDVQQVQWKPVLRQILYHFWPLSAVFLVFICTFLLGALQPAGNHQACRPDSQFSISTLYNPWVIGGLFHITLHFGSLSFSTAKFIDVTWDIVRLQQPYFSQLR